ncbi:MAG: hypothetical protein JNM24_13835 [Bdellovibrionaceae bacterium]|nr:hypothetical protein [Pseudobdellovibrionaceae bacterium]
MLRYLQPSSWFFIFLALLLSLYFSTKLQGGRRSAPMMKVSPASLVSFGQ